MADPNSRDCIRKRLDRFRSEVGKYPMSAHDRLTVERQASASGLSGRRRPRCEHSFYFFFSRFQTHSLNYALFWKLGEQSCQRIPLSLEMAVLMQVHCPLCAVSFPVVEFSVDTFQLGRKFLF